MVASSLLVAIYLARALLYNYLFRNNSHLFYNYPCGYSSVFFMHNVCVGVVLTLQPKYRAKDVPEFQRLRYLRNMCALVGGFSMGEVNDSWRVITRSRSNKANLPLY